MGVDFTTVNIETADIFIFAGIVLAAICAIWGIRKMILIGNDWEPPDDYDYHAGPPTGWYDEDNNLHTYEGHEDEYNAWLDRISKHD